LPAIVAETKEGKIMKNNIPKPETILNLEDCFAECDSALARAIDALENRLTYVQSVGDVGLAILAVASALHDVRQKFAATKHAADAVSRDLIETMADYVALINALPEDE
jgi:hypothetical protein